MKYANKWHKLCFTLNSLVVNAKVRYPEASLSLCCNNFLLKRQKEISEITAAGRGKEAKVSNTERKLGLQLKEKWNASSTVVNSRLSVIIKFQS